MDICFFLIEGTILVTGCQVWGCWLGSLDWLRGWACSTRNVGYLGLSFLGFPRPLCRSRYWAGSRWDGTACHHPSLCLGLEDEYLSTHELEVWVGWSTWTLLLTGGGGEGRCCWGYIFLVGLACHWSRSLLIYYIFKSKPSLHSNQICRVSNFAQSPVCFNVSFHLALGGTEDRLGVKTLVILRPSAFSPKRIIFLFSLEILWSFVLF